MVHHPAENKHYTTQIKVCLINFVLAAFLGVLLRSSHLVSLPFNYRYLTHAHSHIALLGWAYLVIFVFVVRFYLGNQRNLRRLFWVTQLAVTGMFVSFPFQGYALFSIIFSTLHIFCSYAFFALSRKKLKKINTPSSLLLLTGLYFMLLSTLGVWALPVTMSIWGDGSTAYQIAIQFFLHFQFNGWFWLAIIGMLFYYFEQSGGSFPSKRFKTFYLLSIAGAICTVGMPVYGFVSHPFWYGLNLVGIICLMVSVALIIQPLRHLMAISRSRPMFLLLLILAIVSVLFKAIVQLFGIMEVFLRLAHAYPSWKIGFIHLLMLGALSGSFLAFILKEITLNKPFFWVGTTIFLAGFAGTEVLLFLQGWRFYFELTSLPYYNESLWVLSLLLFFGVLMMLLSLWIVGKKQMKKLGNLLKMK